MAKRGFLPCFSAYDHNHFPVEKLYDLDSNVRRAKALVSAFIDSESPSAIKNQIGGKDIKPIRPDSQEGKRLIQHFSFPYEIFRVDYGRTPLRIIFGLSKADRMAYILAFDVSHSTFSGKHRK